MTELATVGTFAYLALWVGVAALLVAMGITDMRERRIPNELVASVGAAWILMQAIAHLCEAFTGLLLEEVAWALGFPRLLAPLFALPSPAVGVLTAVVAVGCLAGAGALYERFFFKPAMGAGDVKLIGAFALFLGPVPTVLCLMLACLFALAAALPARSRTFPFAPALILAFVCVVLVEL